MERLGLCGNKGCEFKEAFSPPSGSTGGSRVRSLGQSWAPGRRGDRRKEVPIVATGLQVFVASFFL